MTWQANTGRAPRESVLLDANGEFAGWRRVHVRLFNGHDSGRAGHAAWPAGGGKPPTVWVISRPPHNFEIKDWKFA